jgi:hypothetical protein
MGSVPSHADDIPDRKDTKFTSLHFNTGLFYSMQGTEEILHFLQIQNGKNNIN